LRQEIAFKGSIASAATYSNISTTVAGVSISKREKCTLSKTEGLAASLNWFPKWIEERG
jgi:hypothetical protein